MGNVNSTSDFVSAVVERSENHKITHLPMPSAGTEYSHTLQSNVKVLEFQVVNTDATLQYAFTATKSGTEYITVSVGCREEFSGIKFSSDTLYIQSDKAGSILEILELY